MSFHTASKFGLKYVEFDVQLTSGTHGNFFSSLSSLLGEFLGTLDFFFLVVHLFIFVDGIPVIYHNWRVQTQTLKKQPVFTAIGDLTLEQFKSLDVRHQNG